MTAIINVKGYITKKRSTMVAHNRCHIYVLVTCLLLCNLTEGQKDFVTETPCPSKTTCKECIQTKSCVWCTKPDFGDEPRCFQPNNGSCPSKFQWNHLWSSIDYLADRHVKIFSSNESHQAYLRAPTNSTMIHLKLRINQEQQFTIKYIEAEYNPVDLYYLMDLSKSMKDPKEKLYHLGKTLAETLPNITNNFKLGVGSFSNKIHLPNSATANDEPCQGCVTSHGYRNVMALSEDSRRFHEMIKNITTSSNLDAPQKGLNALFQAVVCKQQISWRNDSKKFLVYSAHVNFHHAEDGKLRRNTLPNDGKCHLDDKGIYTHSTIQNYPSISQINQKVRENLINIIFAVPQEQIEVYAELSRHIEGSAVAILSDDSAEVLNLIREQYTTIPSSVEMKDTATSPVKITYHSSCSNDDLIETNKCSGLTYGDIVEFKTEIVVTSCPENPEDWFQTIAIYPLGKVGGGGDQATVFIVMEMICECPCERENDPFYEISSPICNHVGTYRCGDICECEDKFYGDHCQHYKQEWQYNFQ